MTNEVIHTAANLAPLMSTNLASHAEWMGLQLYNGWLVDVIKWGAGAIGVAVAGVVVNIISGKLNARKLAIEKLEAENKELRETVDKFKNSWKNNYVLHRTTNGIPVMEKKHDVEGEPHWLCPTCFYNDKPSPLVVSWEDGQGYVCFCPVCEDRDHAYQVHESPEGNETAYRIKLGS